MAKYGKPVISRETRRLLITILLSVATLWVLARVRFQDRSVSVAPVPPMLAQLRSESGFEDLARVVSSQRPTVAAAIVPADGGASLRIGPTAGVRVAGNRFELVTLPQDGVPSLTPWAPRLLDYPRYVIAADVLGEAVSLRPVFIGSLAPMEGVVWSGPLWRLPPETLLNPGTFLFTTDGLFVGVTVREGGAPAIVPGTSVLERAMRLASEGPRPSGVLGFTVQATPVGVAVSWVDPDGPAAPYLAPTDIIEAIDGQPVAGLDHWQARASRLAPGDPVTLRVRGSNGVHDVLLAAVEPPAPAGGMVPLGLRLRAVPKRGTEVLAVQPDSAAAQAGLIPGDLITVFAGTSLPTPAQIAKLYEDAPAEATLLAAVTRAGGHHVVVLEK